MEKNWYNKNTGFKEELFMKKMMKILCRVLPVVLIGLLVVSNVFGIGDWNQVTSEISGGNGISAVDNMARSIWKTVSLILQILAVAAIVFAGVRYMFAAANEKADIKKQTITLVVGAILVFAAGTVVSIITTVADQVGGAT